MPDNVTIAMIAKRVGKSFLTKLLFHKRHIPTTIAINKTERLNRFYGDFIPDIFIYENTVMNYYLKFIQDNLKFLMIMRKELKMEKT